VTDRQTVYALEFPRLKHKTLARFLPEFNIRHQSAHKPLPGGASVLLWGAKTPTLSKPVTISRLEDGFLRSCGLGAYLSPTLSWVIDKKGLYLDSSKPSDLEYYLQNSQLSLAQTNRAVMLRAQILEANLTKYNLIERPWQRPKTSKKIILVPGQVERDASVRLGSPFIKSNTELLQAVRANNEEAYIVYKPHPDVQAGLRAGALCNQVPPLYDELLLDIAPTVLLDGLVDEIHTMTSLFGFEALLRGVAVTCYGQPFYAGWGLTRDCYPIKRRTKKLTLDELVYESLIRYPRYLNPTSGQLIAAETAVTLLQAMKARPKGRLEKTKTVFTQTLIKGYSQFRRLTDPNF
jgi:capsular polysaccharide export protein